MNYLQNWWMDLDFWLRCCAAAHWWPIVTCDIQTTQWSCHGITCVAIYPHCRHKSDKARICVTDHFVWIWLWKNDKPWCNLIIVSISKICFGPASGVHLVAGWLVEALSGADGMDHCGRGMNFNNGVTNFVVWGLMLNIIVIVFWCSSSLFCKHWAIVFCHLLGGFGLTTSGWNLRNQKLTTRHH